MITRRTTWAMAVGSGLAVANIYYLQPLLPAVARTFGVDDRSAGFAVTLSQVGYGLGIFFLVPLGDRLERRGYVVASLFAASLALLAASLAPSLALLGLACLAVGTATVAPQLMIPFAATLAPEHERGRVVGTVMSGLLVGILGARTVGGLIGDALGWRAVYLIAAGVMVALAGLLRATLPESKPAPTALGYFGLLRSTVGLVAAEPVLRQSCGFGAAGFGAFSAFWTTLGFHLARPPFGYTSGAVGLFGLVGIVGALAAPLAGRLSDMGRPRRTIGLGLVLTLLSFALFAASARSLWGLVVGVILMDLGVQACHISNQSRNFRARPAARSRTNSAYMVSYFAGGALGSTAGAWAWDLAGWTGVCLAGGLMSAAGLVVFTLTSAEQPPRAAGSGRGRRASPSTSPPVHL